MKNVINKLEKNDIKIEIINETLCLLDNNIWLCKDKDKYYISFLISCSPYYVSTWTYTLLTILDDVNIYLDKDIYINEKEKVFYGKNAKTEYLSDICDSCIEEYEKEIYFAKCLYDLDSNNSTIN